MGFADKSWWLESIEPEIEANPTLIGDQQADVTIVGGGFTGLSTAIHLKELDSSRRVSVIEAEVCGYGASGRNGGFSMTLFGLTKGITKMRFGNARAKEAHGYMEDAVDYLDGFIGRHQLSCDYEKSGYLLVATNPAQVKRIEHELKIVREWGVDGIEEWSQERLRQEFNTDFYQFGWYEPRCGIIHPAKLTRAMKSLAETKGVTIYENSPASAFRKDKSGDFLVTTEQGSVRSEHLVMTTNAYSLLFPQLKRKQTPVFTHIVMTEPLTKQQLQSIGWQSRAGVEDALDLIHYYRLTADNRIVMGGGDVSMSYGKNYDKDRNEKVFRHLTDHITQIFPQLEGIKISHQWGGPVSVTVDMAPVIGSIGKDPRALYSMGYIGHGVSASTYNGLTMAELVCNVASERTQMFFVDRKLIPWPPEPVKYAMARTIKGFMKLEDKLRFEPKKRKSVANEHTSTKKAAHA